MSHFHYTALAALLIALPICWLIVKTNRVINRTFTPVSGRITALRTPAANTTSKQTVDLVSYPAGGQLYQLQIPVDPMNKRQLNDSVPLMVSRTHPDKAIAQSRLGGSQLLIGMTLVFFLLAASSFDVQHYSAQTLLEPFTIFWIGGLLFALARVSKRLRSKVVLGEINEDSMLESLTSAKPAPD